MNINPNHQEQDEVIGAEEVMAHAMEYIWDNFIEPKESEFDNDQRLLVGVIGATFRAIARQAASMEEIQKSMGNVIDQDISKN
tara:strand:+ start:890 stop:1138 length:249 start_codon:yes stop_codon:yes gene_type:complete